MNYEPGLTDLNKPMKWDSNIPDFKNIGFNEGIYEKKEYNVNDIPPGKYDVQVKFIEDVPMKSQDNARKYKLSFAIENPLTLRNRYIYQEYAYIHTSERYLSNCLSSLKALSKAALGRDFKYIGELMDKKLTISVIIEPPSTSADGSKTYKAKHKINGYKSVEGAIEKEEHAPIRSKFTKDERDDETTADELDF